jgi:starch phosphorylase
MYHEASGTSGMTAAMNGALNLSMPDGWMPEFAEDGKNCFLIKPSDQALTVNEQDGRENLNLLDILETKVLPMYYSDRIIWMALVKKAAEDVVPLFDADRLAREYYELMYTS